MRRPIQTVVALTESGVWMQGESHAKDPEALECCGAGRRRCHRPQCKCSVCRGAPGAADDAAVATEIGQVSAVGSGCFQASFPSLVWHATTCVTAPERPFAPAPAPSRWSGPDTVGNGARLLGRRVGHDLQGDRHVYQCQPQDHREGPDRRRRHQEGQRVLPAAQHRVLHRIAGVHRGEHSVQLPCVAAIRLHHRREHRLHAVLADRLQQQLPRRLDPVLGNDCYTNSARAGQAAAALTAKSLATLSLSGSAKSGGNDEVELTIGGHATLATGKDSKIDLAHLWNTSEWDVFGDGGGGEAFFGANTTLEAVTKLTATSSSAPTCDKEGFTGETNNLNSQPPRRSGASRLRRWAQSRRTARPAPRAALELPEFRRAGGVFRQRSRPSESALSRRPIDAIRSVCSSLLVTFTRSNSLPSRTST